MTEPTDPTGADLDQAIITASRVVIAAKLARPRDQDHIDAAIAERDRLRGLRDAAT